jgi:hypothetical protein
LQKITKSTVAEEQSEKTDEMATTGKGEDEKERVESVPEPRMKTTQSKRKETTPEPENRASDDEIMPRTPTRATTPRVQPAEITSRKQTDESAAERELPPSQARNID